MSLRLRPLVLISCLIVPLAAVGFQQPTKKIPRSVGEEAIKRIGKLKTGMPEQVVFKTLGLDGYGLKAQSWGSGPKDAWPSWYFVTPDRAILLCWNLGTRPPTLTRWSVEKMKAPHR